MTRKQKIVTAQRKIADLYFARFGVTLVDRMRELLQKHPNITAPSWISWEGHKYTNCSTSRGLVSWINSLV